MVPVSLVRGVNSALNSSVSCRRYFRDGLPVFVGLPAVPCHRLRVWSTSGVCLRPCAARPYAPWASCVCTVPSCHPPPQSYAFSRAFCRAHPPLLPLFSFLLVFVACLGLSAYHSFRHRYSSASDKPLLRVSFNVCRPKGQRFCLLLEACPPRLLAAPHHLPGRAVATHRCYHCTHAASFAFSPCFYISPRQCS